MTYLDHVSQSDPLYPFRSRLVWNAYINSAGVSIPRIEIEMFIKDYPIPVRKPKLTEINTLTQPDPVTGHERNAQGLFFGAPEPLQVSFSGWIITPVTPVYSGATVIGYKWRPVDYTGAALGWGNISYTQVISAFIQGELNPTTNGSLRRKDPDSFIAPYGQSFQNPVITSFSPQESVNMKKQAFSMTLLLES